MERKTKSGWKPWKPPPEKQDRWDRWGLRGKTVWDWLNLLVIPVMLALVAGVFTTLQIIYQTAAESERQQAIANQTAQVQRFIEEFRVQETSLQAYLDLMADLLLQYNLRSSEVNSEVRAIAQAQTLTTLRKQDAEGKRTVVLFLSDAAAIQSFASDMEPRISLAEADLHGADLGFADLRFSDLRGANLREANLREAGLERAGLQRAELGGANLREANLIGADLIGADLIGANLKGVTLEDAQGVTNEKLEQHAKSLEGATMPNGQKYEEWLKDIEGRKGDQ